MNRTSCSPRTGRIHGCFNQAGAGTGRLSMSDPNLQNIPIRTDEGRRIRLAFVPGDPINNVLLTADYSQIELRVLAHITQEPALMKAFAEDEDIHKAVAAEVFNVPLDQVSRDQRGQAKTINFGIVYGVSAFGLSNVEILCADGFDFHQTGRRFDKVIAHGIIEPPAREILSLLAPEGALVAALGAKGERIVRLTLGAEGPVHVTEVGPARGLRPLERGVSRGL